MPRRTPSADIVVAGVFALVLAAWACWPLPLHPAGVVLGEKGVNAWVIMVWLMDLPLRSWTGAPLTWLNPEVAVDTVPVALPQAFLARLLAPTLGPLLAANLSIYLHVAAGVFGWSLVARGLLPADEVGARSPRARLAASLAVGGAIGLSCILLSTLGNGQPENLGLGWLALAAAGARGTGSGRPALGTLLLAAGTTGAWLSSPYLLMGPLLGAALLALPLARTHTRAVLLTGAVVGAISIPMILHFQPTADQGDRRGLCPASLDTHPAADRQASLPADLGAAARGAPPAGRELLVADPAALLRPGRRPPGHDHLPVDYLGWLPLTAALLAARRDPRARWLLGAALVPLLLALGPVLFFNGWALTTPGGRLLPGPLAGLQALPLVGRLFATVQVPARLLFGTTLFLALAGLPTWWTVARRAARRRAPLLLGLVALAPAAEQLLFGPAAPPMPATAARPADAHLALAAFPDDGALVETPPLGWDPVRPAMVDASGVIVPPPVRFQRDLERGWPAHRHTLAMDPCPAGDVLIASVAHSAFAEAVTALLAGAPPDAAGPPRALSEAARDLAAQGFGWYIIHTGTGLIRPDAERRLLDAARGELTLVSEGADGSYLFRLPEPRP